MFSLGVLISNASEDLSTPNSFPLPEGSRRYLGAVADDVGVAAAEADTRGCGFVFGLARYLNSFVTNELSRHCRKLRSNIISPCQQLFLQC